MSKGTIRRDSKKAAKQLRTLAELIYSNSEFRKLLSDINIVFRDIFADATSKVADLASDAARKASETAEHQRPSQGELNNVDRPAEEGQHKDKKAPTAEDVKQAGAQLSSQAKTKGKEVTKQVQKKGKEMKDDVQEYLNKKFPKQRQDAIVNRLKKALLFPILANGSWSPISKRIPITSMLLIFFWTCSPSTPKLQRIWDPMHPQKDKMRRLTSTLKKQWT